MEIFAKNDAFIRESNLDKKNTFVLNHNKFSTLTKDEYRKLLGKKQVKNQNVSSVLLSEQNLSDNVDWRTKGAVNPIQN